MSQVLELTIEDNLFSLLKQKAVNEGADVQTLAQEAIQRYLQAEAEQKMQQEITAYHNMHVSLLQEYKGQFVAVHHGRVIDHDAERLALYLRIRQHYPDETILIRQVNPEVEKTWMLRTPKFERG